MLSVAQPVSSVRPVPLCAALNRARPATETMVKVAVKRGCEAGDRKRRWAPQKNIVWDKISSNGASKCWAELEPELLQKLCTSMTTRLQRPMLSTPLQLGVSIQSGATEHWCQTMTAKGGAIDR